MIVDYNNLPEAIGIILEKLQLLEARLDQNLNNHNPYQQSEDLLTVEEAADYLRISPSTLYTKVGKNQVPFLKNGKRLYFKKSELANSLENCKPSLLVDFNKQADFYLSSLKSKSNAA